MLRKQKTPAYIQVGFFLILFKNVRKCFGSCIFFLWNFMKKTTADSKHKCIHKIKNI